MSHRETDTTSTRNRQLGKKPKQGVVPGKLPRKDHDVDNDHSFSQLSVHEALTRNEGQSAWTLADYMFGEWLAS